jgi:hypothetical protein
LYRAIEARDAVLGEQILRRHLKGVDAYFRMFFSEGPPPAPTRTTASKRVMPKPAERRVRR